MNSFCGLRVALALLPTLLVSARAASPALATNAPGTVSSASLNLAGTGFYLDRGKWAAIKPDQRKEASVKFTVPAANGRYRVTLHAVGENDGNSWYEAFLGGHSLSTFTCPPSKEMFEEGPAFTTSWGDVAVNQGETVEVRARTASTRAGSTAARAGPNSFSPRSRTTPAMKPPAWNSPPPSAPSTDD